MNKKLNKKKVLILILIILAIILTIVFSILYKRSSKVRSFFDNNIFRKNITENTLPKLDIESSYCYSFNNHVVVLSRNVLTFYNESANKTSSLDIDISEPIFESAGKYLCIAEKNGKNVYLINGKDIVWQKSVEGNISQISLNKNCYVVIAIADTTYKNICKVYSDTGAELFTSFLSKSYIIDSAISNDNKYIAIAETNFSGISIQSSVKIISIDKTLQNSADTIEYNYVAPIDDFIISIDYCNSNVLICLYDNHISVVKNNTTEEISNFNTSNILFADTNNKIIQIEKKKTGAFSSEFELQIIDPSTLDKKTYTLEKEPKSMEVYGNVIAINYGSEVLFINNSGWLIKDYTSYQEVQSVVLSNNVAGIVYKNKIEFLGL